MMNHPHVSATLWLASLVLLFAPGSFAQQDGKAQAQKEHLWPYEELVETEPYETAAPSQMAVWRRYVAPEKRGTVDSILALVGRVGETALAEGRMNPIQERAFRGLRILRPGTLGNDGTYEYVFVALPYIPSADYSIRSILHLGLEPDRADALAKTFQAALGRPDRHLAVTTLP